MSKSAKLAVKAAEAPKMGGLGLDSLGDLSGLLSDPVSSGAGGAPLELPLDVIEEDPAQPRTAANPGFSDKSMEEMASSIRERGVKSPISVREKPGEPGRYLINHGARRYRGSKIAGKQTIPAFIDNDYNEADQVIENIQRNELTSREIAEFLQREKARGKKQGEIAKAIGKSDGFVSQHLALLSLPEPLEAAFNAGRTSDVSLISEISSLYKKHTAEVERWLTDPSQDITRNSFKLLRDFIEDKSKRDPNTVDAFSGQTDAESDDEQNPGDPIPEPKAPKEADPNKLKKAIVLVCHEERMARLLLDRRPPAEGWAWLKYEDDGQEVEVDLGKVRLMSLMEA